MKKTIVITSISIIIIFILVISFTIIYDELTKDSNNNVNNVNMKNQPQSISDSTQLAMEDKDIELRERELNQKMKSILYGILNYTGDIEYKINM